MAKGTYGVAVRQIGTLWNAGTIGNLTDAQLLERFAVRDGHGADQAFALLVERHGAIVLRTCRARLRDEHATQDAVQATFLVLACRAGSLRVQGSLGPWLHSVAWRVASSARSSAARRRHHERLAAELTDRTTGPVLPDDWEPVLHEEVDRLADRYRKPVILCGLAGLSTSQAARELGWPVGTVRSRLARGRARLRDRLTRRGLAPAAAVVGITEAAEAAPAAVSAAMAMAVVRGVAGVATAGRAPTAFAASARSTLRSMSMIQAIRTTAAILALGATGLAAAVVLARPGDGGGRGRDGPQDSPARRTADPPSPADPPRPAAPSPRPAPSLAEQLEAIKAEYRAKDRALWAALEKVETRREQNELYGKMRPDEVAYCRRMIDLASIAPKDPAARDALLWVIDHPGWSDTGTFGDEFARAAARLVRDHGDDPEAVRIGLELDNILTVHRDQLLYGFLASAKNPEAKGLARLALGKYLRRKSQFARGARAAQGRQTMVNVGVVGDDGKPHDLEQEQSDEEYAYLLQMKQCDPDYLRAEAERLFEEVIKEYGDLPCITHRVRKLEVLLKEPKPSWNGKVMTEEELDKLRKMVASRPSLAKVAEGHLDEMRNLVVGMPAPEIDGVGLDGRPLRLSEYRGKVVALVFWGSWCGPCMRDVPHERELVEKYRGRPFAMLGVDCNEPRAKAARVMEAERMAWPSWHDGEEGGGPIASRYHVSGYPTVFVIDAGGKIRSTKALGEGLDKLVEDLVAEAETKPREK